MKKFFIVFFVLCLCFCGCVKIDPQIDPDLAVMEITESSNTAAGFTITNNSKDKIVFGEEYALEFFDGKSWTEVPERTETFFIAIAHVLESGETYTSSVNLEMRYGALSDGKYRMAKDVRFENDMGEDFGGQRVYAEFEVTAAER